MPSFSGGDKPRRYILFSILPPLFEKLPKDKIGVRVGKFLKVFLIIT